MRKMNKGIDVIDAYAEGLIDKMNCNRLRDRKLEEPRSNSSNSKIKQPLKAN